MSYKSHTTWERLYWAVNILASSRGSIQERVCNAYLNLVPLKISEFPEELQEEFEALGDELTKVEPSGGEGSVATTTKVMSEEKASEIASKIVSIYDKIARKYCSDEE